MSKYWVQTFTGKRFDLLDPTPDMVDSVDICISLSRLNRYIGHSDIPISVASHSALVAYILSKDYPHLKVHGGLHDTPEAYTGDINNPLKTWLKSQGVDIDGLESRILAAIYKKFGLSLPTVEEERIIKRADMVALVTEKYHLLGPEPDSWGLDPSIKPWPWEVWSDILGRSFFYDIIIDYIEGVTAEWPMSIPKEGSLW